MKKKQSPYALLVSILFLFAALFAYAKLPPVGAAGIVYTQHGHKLTFSKV